MIKETEGTKEVHLVFEKNLNREVALKYMKEEPNRAELEILRKLKGVLNMVQLIEAFWIPQPSKWKWKFALMFEAVDTPTGRPYLRPTSFEECRLYLSSWLKVKKTFICLFYC